MKQEGFIVAKTGSKKLVVKLEEIMPTDKYHVVLSVMDKDLDFPVIMEVPFDTKEEKKFTILFRDKLKQKVTIAYIVEVPS